MKAISLLLINNLKDYIAQLKLHSKEEEYVLLNYSSKKYVQGWRGLVLADCMMTQCPSVWFQEFQDSLLSSVGTHLVHICTCMQNTHDKMVRESSEGILIKTKMCAHLLSRSESAHL